MSKKQLGFNTVSGWISQLVFALTGFVLMPYIVSRLGAQGYGIYQLARSALVFFMFLQLGMGPTLVRFFAKAIAKADQEEIRRISSTAQLLLGSTGLFVSTLGMILIPVFVRFYDIPSALASETTWLLACMAVSLFLNMTIIVPQGLVFGANRYDLANLIDICGNLMRLTLIIVFFEFIRPSIYFIGLGILLAQLFQFIALFSVAFKNAGKMALFSPKYIAKETMQSLFGFSLLNFANTVAAAIVFQGPVLVIGKVLGEEMVAAFAPAILISGALQGFLGQTARPLVPLASQDRENNNGAGLAKWAVSMGQLSAFVGFGIVLPLATFGHELISLWIGNELAWIWPVVVVMTTGIAISQVQAANYFLALGGGQIKPTVYSQIVMAIIVMAGISIGTVWFAWGLLEVAFHIGLCILVRNTFYLAYAYSRQFSYEYGRYLWTVYGLPALISTGCIGCGWMLKMEVSPNGLTLLAIELFFVLALYVLSCWMFLLSKVMRQKIITLGLSKIKQSFAAM